MVAPGASSLRGIAMPVSVAMVLGAWRGRVDPSKAGTIEFGSVGGGLCVWKWQSGNLSWTNFLLPSQPPSFLPHCNPAAALFPNLHKLALQAQPPTCLKSTSPPMLLCLLWALLHLTARLCLASRAIPDGVPRVRQGEWQAARCCSTSGPVQEQQQLNCLPLPLPSCRAGGAEHQPAGP